MEIKDFIEKSITVTSKREASRLIAIFLNAAVKDLDDPHIEEYRKALKLVDSLAKKWDVMPTSCSKPPCVTTTGVSGTPQVSAVSIMTLEIFIEKSKTVTSKQEAATLIAELISATASPTFGFEDYEYRDSGYPIDPYDHLDDDNDDSDDDPDDDEEDNETETEMVEKCKKIVGDYDKSLKLADILAKKWDVPFDPELTASLITNMRGNGEGLWNSSSIGC